MRYTGTQEYKIRSKFWTANSLRASQSSHFEINLLNWANNSIHIKRFLLTSFHHSILLRHEDFLSHTMVWHGITSNIQKFLELRTGIWKQKKRWKKFLSSNNISMKIHTCGISELINFHWIDFWCRYGFKQYRSIK